MENCQFDISQFEKFNKTLLQEAKEFPKQTKKFMKAEARKGTKQCKRVARGKGIHKKTGNYMKGFKAGNKVYEWSDADFNILVFNNAPHAHLIEYGHKKYIRGKDTGGYVKGQHVVQTAAVQFEKKFARDIDTELVDYLIKGIEGR